MIDLTLKIDKQENTLWGQINIGDNIIIEKSDSEIKLLAKIKRQLLEFERLHEHDYTLTKQYI